MCCLHGLALILFLALLALTPLRTDAQILSLDTALRQYIEEAIQNNPDVMAWSSRIEAAERRIPQAKAWPDPTLKFSLANLPTNTFAFDQEPMTAAWVSLEQRIPFGGKTGAKKRIARSDLASYGFGETARRYAIASEIVKSWYTLAYLAEAVRTIEAEIAVMDDFIAVARTKYETGRGNQQDVLRAQTKRAQLEDRLAAQRQMRLTESRRLAVLMGRNPDNPPSAPDSLPQSFTAVDRESLLSRLLGENPAIGLAGAELRKAEHVSTLARRAWWPDLMIGVGYGFRQNSPEGIERPDFFRVSAGVNLPLFGHLKQGPQVQEAEAASRVMLYRQRSTKLQMRFELEMLLDQDARLAEQIRLYELSIEPQAEAALSAAAADYAVGKIDFEAVLLAETDLYTSRLERYARVLDRLAVRADLAALVSDPDLMPDFEQ